MVFVIESLSYYRAYLNSVLPQYRLTELFDFEKDATSFHKCISVSNSSWMSTAAITMGNDVCYQHNTSYDWGHKYDQTTICNRWSDSLFYLLKDNGYNVASFTSPGCDETGYRLFLFDLVDLNKKRIGSLFGGNDSYFFNSKHAQQNGLIDYIKKNKNNKFATLSWSYLDHIVVGGNNPNNRVKGPPDRLSCFKETMINFANVLKVLKEEGIYNTTDIYLIGDHGDSYYYTKGLTGETSLQHGTLPLHITTHVPLVVKSSYLPKGNRYDLVSNIDIYSTIVNSLNIKTKAKAVLPKNLFSVDLKCGGREYVLSRNKFNEQKNNNALLPAGVSITNNEYNYMITKDKKYLFYHLLDALNLNNILDGIDRSVNNTHYKFWFHEAYMKSVQDNTLAIFNKIIKELIDSKYISLDNF